MMAELRKEINTWQYKECMCETSTLSGINRLIHLNSSHPIRAGISAIYFIRSSNTSRDPLFGSTKVKWTYHCCIGFKDIYYAKDWFIDLSYRCMMKDIHIRMNRMIPREEYLANIPCTVNAFVIPLRNLEYFVNQFQLRMSAYNLKQFLDITVRPCFMWMFDPRNSESSDFYRI